MRPIIAVDPGAKGALVAMNSQGLIEIFDVPLILEYGSKKTVDVDAVRTWVKKIDPAFVVFELVHDAPKDGKSSGGNFMKNFAALIGACAGYKRKYIIPSQWKAYSGLVGKVKDMSLVRVAKEYPAAARFLVGAKNPVDRADAILLGRYAMFKWRLEYGTTERHSGE